MNETPNAPLPVTPAPGPAAASSMFQTWIDAVTKPRESTYAAIASSPRANTSTAFLWVFIGSLISSFLTILAPSAGLRDLQRLLQQQGLNNEFTNALGSGGAGLGTKVFQLVCGAPIAAVIAVVGFAIVVAVTQWVARMFGGRGTYDRLAYAFAAISAPVGIVTGLLSLLGAIPFIGLCFGLLSFAVVIYALVLQIMAAKAVNGFTSYGPAVGSVLIPGAVVFLLCCCLAFGIGALLAPVMGNVFSSTGPFPFPTP